MSESINRAAPIGVFDSGVGGLSVLRQLRRRMPHESFIYIADSRFAPYGEKSADFIERRSIELSQFLLNKGAKLIVVACNTATASAVAPLREMSSTPIVAMEPAVKPAVAMTRNGRIGVLATTGTLSSARFAALLDRFSTHAEVHTRSCDGWVELVESVHWHADLVKEGVRSHIEPLLEAGVDTLILGCTHYPFLKPIIAEVAGPNVAIVDTGAAVARRVEQVLQDKQLGCSQASPGLEFYSSAHSKQARGVIERLWGEPVDEVLSFPESDLEPGAAV